MSEGARPAGGAGAAGSRSWAAFWVVGSYLAMSAVFSWPAARFDPGVLVTRHFDLLPAVWLLERAPGTFPNMVHAASAWPFGESLARVDSYLLLGMAWLNGGRLPAWSLVALLTWLGPAINAISAEFTARRALGVARPWSWIAGCAYGFSGVAATAILEGHIYHLLNPWLPLLLWSLWRGLGEDGRRLHGLYAGLFFAAGLFTTAYFGVAGALLIVVLLLSRPRRAARLLPGLVVVAAMSGGYYVWLFSMGGRWADGQVQPDLFLRMGSVTLGGLAVWSEALDLRHHSIATPVGFAVFWSMGLAPVVLAGRRRWRVLFGVALLAVFIALGRTVRADLGAQGYGSPLALLVNLPGLAFFRFPVRLMWLYSLASGLVAAMVLEALAERVRSRWLWPVLLAAALEALVGNGMPYRIHRGIAQVPSAYALAPGDKTVLDLFGAAFDRSSGEVEMWARNLSCYYQATHGRPIFEVCIGTSIDSPRELVDRWLAMRLMQFQDEGGAAVGPQRVADRLAELDVGAVVLHGDFYRPNDRDAVEAGLRRVLGPPLGESWDGGEHVLVFAVSGRDGGSSGPERAYAAVVSDLR